MFEDFLRSRFNEYPPGNALEQGNMLKEAMQHYVLASLSKHGLFSEAAFHGGTCLRIVHGLQRFSEDLDFLLKKPDPAFQWSQYLAGVQRDCHADGLEFEIADQNKSEKAVRKTFLKTDSIGSLLYFQLPFGWHRHQKMRIKLEIDIQPPAGSSFETAYLMFPRPEPLTIQTLESGFALKIHALLCRSYVKGRDWFDFLWYVARKVAPDFNLLANALEQQGPWAGTQPDVTIAWLAESLASRIKQIDWALARDDVQRFLPLSEQAALRNWDREMFLYHVEVLLRNFKVLEI